jgi:group I intron endonuclease
MIKGQSPNNWVFETTEKDQIEGLYKTYIIICPISKLIRYVGVTRRKLSRRANYHLNSKHNDDKTLWVQWVTSCGMQPIFKTVEYCDCKSNAQDSEEFFIRFFESIGHPVFNKCYGFGSKGVSTKGRYTMTDAHRCRLSEINKGRKKSASTIEKLRIASTGKVRTKESIQKQINSMTGHRHSESTKRLMSKNNSQCKRLIQLNPDKSVYREWRTINEACDYNNIDRNCLRVHIGSNKIYKKYYWNYGNT